MANFLFLYTYDIYGVSNPQRTKHRTAFQQRYLVVEYMLNNIDKYDTLLFGSSRVQFINPLHVKNKKVYNMTVAEGIPHEHLILLKLFINKGIKLKQVIIALDDFSYQVSFSKHQNMPDTKSHYLATGISIFDFYKTYYFRIPNKKDFTHFKNISNDTNPYLRHHEIIFNQEKAFSTQKISYNKPKPSNPVYLVPTLYNANLINDTIKDLKEIVKICKENNIELLLFINPIHHTTYKYTNLEQLNEFKTRLSYLAPYYDFTIPNEISNNNKYWLETSHFTLEVGDMILSRIYDNNTSIKDFGTYIEKKEKN